MKRPISKTVILGILFAAFVLGVIIYLTLGLRQVECEVCVDIDGRPNCKTVKGENQQDAVQTAKDNACAEISHGRDETIRCSQSPPTRIQCKHL